MCGSENGIGIISGLVGAAVILVSAYVGKHVFVDAHAPQHVITAPAPHLTQQRAPVTLNIDLATARVSFDVRL